MADVEIDTNVKDFTNRNNFGIIVCTSGTRPNVVDGKFIYETDTDKFLHYNGATWVEITGGGVTDHGALTGLADDDHTQYVLVDGTRTMTGDLTINKVGPKVILEPTDSDSPALILEDTASNYKGRVYVTGDDMVVLGEDGELYLSTAVTTGGNVLLETKGVTRLTIADAGIASTVPLAMGTNKVTGLAAATTNGDALRYEQIADASFTNLLKNGDFESWSAGASSVPDKWDITGTGAAISKESTEIFSGVNSAKCTYGSSTLFLRNSDRADPQLYLQHRGKYIIVGCMVKTSTASIAALSIGTDAVSTKSAYHSGSGSWELLTATHLLPVDATDLTLKLRVEGAGVVYFDAVVLVEGSICPVFSPKPLVDDGKSIQIDSTTNAVTLGRDPTADTEAATKKYVDDNAGVGDFLADGTVPMTGNLSMGANNVYLDSGILRMSNGTTLSGSIGFTTGVQNYIQRQLVSGSDYTLLSDQDYMHTWAILGTEKMHLSTADGLKLFTKINMNGLKIEGVSDPTANQEAATKKYVDDNAGVGDFLANGTVPMTGNLQMGVNNIYVDSGIVRLNAGTGLSGSIGFTTGVQNYIQRQLISGSDYVLLNDQDYRFAWAILGTEKLRLDTGGLTLYSTLDANGQTLEKLIQMKGTSTHSAVLDFRGDSAHEIKYNGTTPNDLEYLTYEEHNFKVGTSPGTSVLKIDSNEIAMTTGNRVTMNGVGGGTYIKDDASGNMELHVATGKTVKIVVG